MSKLNCLRVLFLLFSTFQATTWIQTMRNDAYGDACPNPDPPKYDKNSLGQITCGFELTNSGSKIMGARSYRLALKCRLHYADNAISGYDCGSQGKDGELLHYTNFVQLIAVPESAFLSEISAPRDAWHVRLISNGTSTQLRGEQSDRVFAKKIPITGWGNAFKLDDFLTAIPQRHGVTTLDRVLKEDRFRIILFGVTTVGFGARLDHVTSSHLTSTGFTVGLEEDALKCDDAVFDEYLDDQKEENACPFIRTALVDLSNHLTDFQKSLLNDVSNENVTQPPVPSAKAPVFNAPVVSVLTGCAANKNCTCWMTADDEVPVCGEETSNGGSFSAPAGGFASGFWLNCECEVMEPGEDVTSSLNLQKSLLDPTGCTMDAYGGQLKKGKLCACNNRRMMCDEFSNVLSLFANGTVSPSDNGATCSCRSRKQSPRQTSAPTPEPAVPPTPEELSSRTCCPDIWQYADMERSKCLCVPHHEGDVTYHEFECYEERTSLEWLRLGAVFPGCGGNATDLDCNCDVALDPIAFAETPEPTPVPTPEPTPLHTPEPKHSTIPPNPTETHTPGPPTNLPLSFYVSELHEGDEGCRWRVGTDDALELCLCHRISQRRLGKTHEKKCETYEQMESKWASYSDWMYPNASWSGFTVDCECVRPLVEAVGSDLGSLWLFLFVLGMLVVIVGVVVLASIKCRKKPVEKASKEEFVMVALDNEGKPKTSDGSVGSSSDSEEVYLDCGDEVDLEQQHVNKLRKRPTLYAANKF